MALVTGPVVFSANHIEPVSLRFCRSEFLQGFGIGLEICGTEQNKSDIADMTKTRKHNRDGL